MGQKKAVVLLSGGVDSTTCLAIAREQGFEVTAVTVAYGQRHAYEIECAKKVAQCLQAAAHHITTVDLNAVGNSALTADIAVPEGRTAEQMGSGIPVTYVPARNTVLLSCALAWAESVQAFDIFVGVNALDYAGYPDCRPEYIAAFEEMANLATQAAVESGQRLRIHAPLISLTKAEILKRGLALGVDYALTNSCYQPDVFGHACGVCDACTLRLEGFASLGESDRISYQSPQGET